MYIHLCQNKFSKTYDIIHLTGIEFLLKMIGLCPKPDPDDDLQDGSTIEDLHDPIPELFNVLTEQEDIEKRWTTFILPVHFDVLAHKSNHGILDLSKGKVCHIMAIHQC